MMEREGDEGGGGGEEGGGRGGGGAMRQLPEEMWHAIFSFLDVPDLSRSTAVCKYWQRITEEETLWKAHCPTDISTSLQQQLRASSASPSSWKTKAIHKYRTDLNWHKFTPVTITKLNVPGLFNCNIWQFRNGLAVIGLFRSCEVYDLSDASDIRLRYRATGYRAFGACVVGKHPVDNSRPLLFMDLFLGEHEDGNYSVAIIDLASNKQIGQLPKNSDWTRPLACSANGRWLISKHGGLGNQYAVWDVARMVDGADANDPTRIFNASCFTMSPSSDILFVCYQSKMQLVHCKDDGTLIDGPTFNTHGEVEASAANDRFIALKFEDGVQVLDYHTGQFKASIDCGSTKAAPVWRGNILILGSKLDGAHQVLFIDSNDWQVPATFTLSSGTLHVGPRPIVKPVTSDEFPIEWLVVDQERVYVCTEERLLWMLDFACW